MSATERKRLYTVDDYMALDDDKRYQLVEGELLLMPSPRTSHQLVLGNLHLLLGRHVRDNGLGKVLLAPADVVLDRKNVFQPDLYYVAEAREPEILDEANCKGSPDLCVEVLSPSTRRLELDRKKRLFAALGVPHLWFVEPDPVEVVELVLGPDGHYAERARLTDGVFRPALFPHLEIPLAELRE